MRIIVQRVFEGFVKVGGQQISRIKQGVLVLIGVTMGDNKKIAEHMASKVLNMRLWQKQGKSWSLSVMDIQGQILVVSQFTLYGIMKGNKPDFHGALPAQQAKELYNYFVQVLKKKYFSDRIKTGQFQAKMEVGSVIDGPVTIQYQKEEKQEIKKTQLKQVINQQLSNQPQIKEQLYKQEKQ